jgi:chromosome segregation ATPase
MSGPVKRLPKWLDRAGFEADKLMRANRVRTEATRIRQQVDTRVQALGARVLELAASGTELDPALRDIVDEVLVLQNDLARKEEEIKAINSEAWTEPAEGGSAPGSLLDPIAQRLQSYVDEKTNNFNCPKCGAIIRPDAAFCPRCGRRVLK